ncbi:MAG: Rrf2 family transcriptional regulator [Clostridiaceae bacterium]|nr:Rrf2 family transcriptional regulator [Clostridiaceae bacterium]
MKISTKGRYGLTAMVDIAINAISENVTIKSISERQDISEGYLEQIFSSLRKAGLVKSIKGSQGGYILGNSAINITIGDILRTLEGNLSVLGDEIKDEEVNMLQRCIKTKIWNQMDTSISSIVDSITLENLVIDYKKMADTSKSMYYI